MTDFDVMSCCGRSRARCSCRCENCGELNKDHVSPGDGERDDETLPLPGPTLNLSSDFAAAYNGVDPFEVDCLPVQGPLFPTPKAVLNASDFAATVDDGLPEAPVINWAEELERREAEAAAKRRLWRGRYER